MARITVEDCVTRIPNRFEPSCSPRSAPRRLGRGAADGRARQRQEPGGRPARDRRGTVELDHLRYELIHGLRRHVEIEDQPDDLMMAYQDHPLVEPGPPLALDDDEFDDPGSAPQPEVDEEPLFE